MANILVIGSSNTDMVVKTARFPQPGETIIGGDFYMFPGGKGANQAVAAARLGGQVTFICKTGNDIFGQQAMDGFRKENILTQYCLADADTPSGIALITVNGNGENEIVVASGANNQLGIAEIEQGTPAFQTADIVLLQLEIPLNTVAYAIEKAKALSKPTVLNPAPAQPLPDILLNGLYLITPNETEAEILTGVRVDTTDDAGRAAAVLLQKGVQNVLITLGARGAYFQNHDHSFIIEPPRVTAVDTTAAGDVFNGALCVALAEGKDWRDAIQYACRAGAISVTRMGAQSSAPYRHELN